MEGNKCEKKLVRLVAKMYPDMFAYNGNRLFGKKIGIYTPDILGTYYPIIIEHHGTPFHSTPEKVKKDKIRLKYLKDQGYYVLIIWDYEDKNKNKVKIQIKDFVDNAIQDISQLAV